MKISEIVFAGVIIMIVIGFCFILWVGQTTTTEMKNKAADNRLKKTFLFDRLRIRTNDGLVSGKLIVTTTNGTREEKNFQIVLE